MIQIREIKKENASGRSVETRTIDFYLIFQKPAQVHYNNCIPKATIILIKLQTETGRINSTYCIRLWQKCRISYCPGSLFN